MTIQPCRSTPVFDQDTLPAALRGRHSTRSGVWGVVRVLEGRIRRTYLDPLADIVSIPSRRGPASGTAAFRRADRPDEGAGDFYDRPPAG